MKRFMLSYQVFANSIVFERKPAKFVYQIIPYDKKDRHFFALAQQFTAVYVHLVCVLFGLYHRMGTLVRRVCDDVHSYSPRRLFNTGAHLVVYSSVQSLGIFDYLVYGLAFYGTNLSAFAKS